MKKPLTIILLVHLAIVLGFLVYNFRDLSDGLLICILYPVVYCGIPDLLAGDVLVVLSIRYKRLTPWGVAFLKAFLFILGTWAVLFCIMLKCDPYSLE